MDVLKIKQFLSGNGCGYGDGNGSGIKNINGYDVYEVDDTPTIFTHIHGNVAKGYVLEQNVILKPCYIVKGNGYFAHGETLEKAQEALREKIMDDMDVGEKLAMFRENFPEADKLYPLGDFYDWHHILTGSCEMGRKSFAASHGLDLEKGEMTVRELIALTENAYGGEVTTRRHFPRRSTTRQSTSGPSRPGRRYIFALWRTRTAICSIRGYPLST